MAILREVDTQGKSIEETCKCHKVSVQTFYLWRSRFGSLQENEVKRLRKMEKENARLNRLLAERDLELDVVREFLKKVAGAAERRKAVGFLTAGGLYVRRSCAILRINRSSLGYLPLKDDSALVQKLKELAGRNPCHGYRILQGLRTNLEVGVPRRGILAVRLTVVFGFYPGVVGFF